MSVVWHDLECGRYAADLPLWQVLAERFPAPILDVGAGTGRVTLPLARAGSEVTALDSDAQLLEELRERASGLPVTTALADAREFELEQVFGLIIVPMQTIQLLGGPQGRQAFLGQARRHLKTRGRLAIALADELELFEARPGALAPLPDVAEVAGIVYSSMPTAVRLDRNGFVLERRRDVVSIEGQLSSETDRIRLDQLDAAQLIAEARLVELEPAGSEEIAPTADHVGSTVVMFDG
jgi:SAM-dependent methyltransferase